MMGKSKSHFLKTFSSPRHQASKPDGRRHDERARSHHRSGVGVWAAACAVVGYVVPLGGDFEDGAGAGGAAVVVVY